MPLKRIIMEVDTDSSDGRIEEFVKRFAIENFVNEVKIRIENDSGKEST